MNKNFFINMDGSRLLMHDNNGPEIRMIDDQGNIVYRHLTDDECYTIMKWIKDHKFPKNLVI